MFASSSIVMEKNSGCFERDRISGLTVLEILGAQIGLQQFIMILQNSSILIILYSVFNNIQAGNIITLFFILYLCQIVGIFYGILLALVIQKEDLVSYAGIGTILSITLLNGCLWATEGMHWLMKPTGIFLKAGLGVDPYFNVSQRGWGILHWGVGDRMLLLIGESVGLGLLSYTLVKLKLISF